MKYIVSTMANSVAYTFYAESSGNSIPAVKRKIKIEGGAGLPSITKNFGEMAKDIQGTPMWTPYGLVTPVTEADLDLLMTHHVFKAHLDGGLVKIINDDVTTDSRKVEKIALQMETDSFAPLTPSNAKGKINSKTKVTVGDTPESAGRI